MIDIGVLKRYIKPCRVRHSEISELAMQFPDKVYGMVSHIDYSAVTVNARKRSTPQGENSRSTPQLSR
jgi:hypothetical protein